MHYLHYDAGPATDDGQPASEAARLQAALEALAARDQVLADRTRRLAALEDVAARLAATSARLEAAEQELAALRRAHGASVAARDARLAELEQRLVAPAPAPPTASQAPTAEAASADDRLAALGDRLQSDLAQERRRSARLTETAREAAALEVDRLEQALEAARRRVAALEAEQADIRRDAGASLPEGPYAHWEQWFRRRLAERDAADLARAREALGHQRAVLEEKERLIALLLQRLRTVGEVSEGPDDLKEIVGIGPAIEEMLHGMGITTFEQLAALTEEDVARIGGALGAFHERIRRDRWTEQAADLARRRVQVGPGLYLR